MLSNNTKRDIPSAILNFFAAHLPIEARLWAKAILAELETIPNSRERLVWALSGSWGLGKIWLSHTVREFFLCDGRPLAVVIICAYHAIFCGALLYVIVSQIPRITSPWLDALFPALFMLFAAIIPGVIALGLWVLDDSARYLAIFFAMLHGLGNYALLLTGRLPWAARPIGRIGLDILIVGILVSPPIKRAFKPPSIHLGLNS